MGDVIQEAVEEIANRNSNEKEHEINYTASQQYVKIILEVNTCE